MADDMVHDLGSAGTGADNQASFETDAGADATPLEVPERCAGDIEIHEIQKGREQNDRSTEFEVFIKKVCQGKNAQKTGECGFENPRNLIQTRDLLLMGVMTMIGSGEQPHDQDAGKGMGVIDEFIDGPGKPGIGDISYIIGSQP
jgi:hypothetical protein